VKLGDKKGHKLEAIAEWLERTEPILSRILIGLRRIIITLLLFLGFLIGAYGIWITMTAHDPIKSANEIDQHHTVTRITKD